MANIKVTLPDNSVIEAESGMTIYDIIGIIGKGLQKSALAAMVNDVATDLSEIITNDIKLVVYTFKNPEGKKVYWHSTSHILAQAVKRINPKAKYTIGPAIDNGFYYDFDVEQNFTDDDLVKIEEEMYKIIKEDIEVTSGVMSKNDAVKYFSEKNEPYKVELINDIADDNVKVYKQGEFADLCRGPHIPRTSYIKAVKLMKTSGAYWRGDEKNKMLQRIYGISFTDKKELDDYVRVMEEAKERDHRKIGSDMQLYEVCQEVGQGLILWTPQGGRIRAVIENFWRKQHYRNGYEIVYTPHIGRSLLWETSGHLGFYKEGMYSPMDIDGEDYYVKPMNCPFHIMIYKSQKRSYRDFPLRWAEFGTVYRYERTGTLHGLLRVRGFTQDDAHLFIRMDQLEEEIISTFNFSLFMLRSFGFENFAIKLSTRPDDSVGSPELWEKAETALKEALAKTGVDYKINEKDGAFYGPKIDIAVKDAIGREWQLSTLQLDFNLPERFALNYTGSDGQEHRPIMIHRALLGSLERFFGILIEHYKGAFPVWLAPVQVILLSLSENDISDIQKIKNVFMENDVRVDTDFRNETVNYKVRDAATKKIPFICVIGKKEIENNTISVRKRGEQKSETMTIDELLKLIQG